MPVRVIYDDDADGFASAYAAHLKFGDSAIYTPADRGDDPPTDFTDSDEVYVLDFNYTRPVMKAIAEKVKHICLLDHHFTALQELGDLPFAHFDLAHSTAVIAWKYFLPDSPIPPFYGYVEDHDLGKEALPQSREVHLAVECYDRDFSVWRNISGVTLPRNAVEEYECISRLATEGEVCKLYADQRVSDMAEQCRMATFYLPNTVLNTNGMIRFNQAEPESPGVFRVPVVNATTNHSAVCKKLLDNHPDAKLAAYYHDLGSGRRQWGLRSRGDFDCSVVAAAFGGGGHPQACGFQTFQDSDCDIPAPLSKMGAQ